MTDRETVNGRLDRTGTSGREPHLRPRPGAWRRPRGGGRAPVLVAFLVGLMAVLAAVQGRAQSGAQVGSGPFSALARVDPGNSVLRDAGRGVILDLALSQPTPYRIAHLDGPRRLVVEFREVILDAAALAAIPPTANVTAVRAGTPREGWSRLELDLAHPMALSQAVQQVDEGAAGVRLHLRLDPVPEAAFAARVAAAAAILPDDPRPAGAPPARRGPAGGAPLRVVLDPGHGGIDPGAQRDGLREADLMLTFAGELAEALRRAGAFEVTLTRTGDVFVALETRVAIAREAGADVFLSLHADALSGGGASGATVYTLAQEASDAASAALAERHNRDDLLAGIDLSDQDDLIAGVLMDLARRETAPRTDSLADALVTGLSEAGAAMHRRPRMAAAFSVLKAPDIPSVLLELGFMSSENDLANLQDPVWRARFAEGIVAALRAWAHADAVAAGALRR